MSELSKEFIQSIFDISPEKFDKFLELLKKIYQRSIISTADINSKGEFVDQRDIFHKNDMEMIRKIISNLLDMELIRPTCTMVECPYNCSLLFCEFCTTYPGINPFVYSCREDGECYHCRNSSSSECIICYGTKYCRCLMVQARLIISKIIVSTNKKIC
jgi:hypothetical protein